MRAVTLLCVFAVAVVNSIRPFDWVEHEGRRGHVGRFPGWQIRSKRMDHPHELSEHLHELSDHPEELSELPEELSDHPELSEHPADDGSERMNHPHVAPEEPTADDGSDLFGHDSEDADGADSMALLAGLPLEGLKKPDDAESKDEEHDLSISKAIVPANGDGHGAEWAAWGGSTTRIAHPSVKFTTPGKVIGSTTPKPNPTGAPKPNPRPNPTFVTYFCDARTRSCYEECDIPSEDEQPRLEPEKDKGKGGVHVHPAIRRLYGVRAVSGRICKQRSPHDIRYSSMGTCRLVEKDRRTDKQTDNVFRRECKKGPYMHHNGAVAKTMGMVMWLAMVLAKLLGN